MNLFVLIISSFVIPIGKQLIVVESTECEHVSHEIEADDGETVELSFILPLHTEAPKSWTIYGASGFSSCGEENSLLKNEGENIRSCYHNNLSYVNVNYDRFVATLPKFELTDAGTWIIKRSYEKFNESGSFLGYIEKKNSINVYIVEYDQRFHNKVIEVTEGEYIVIYFREKYSDNKACELHHNEMNNTYDLNEDSYRFKKKGETIQRLGLCGFRMHVKNMSHGNWTFTGQFGWTRRRAAFQVFLKPQIQRSAKRLASGYDYLNDDLPNGISILVNEPIEYWELQKPDGNIIQPSDMSLIDLIDETTHLHEVNVTLGPPSSDDQGLWKVRVAFKNEAILRENEIYVPIEDAPYATDMWMPASDTTRNESGFEMKAILETYIPPRSCSFKKQNGSFTEGKLGDEYKYNSLFRYCSVIFYGTPEGQESLEISFDYEDSKVNGMYAFRKESFSRNPTLRYDFWYSVRAKKYVRLGEELKVKCRNSRRLKKCVLNRGNGTRYIYGESTLLKSVDCYDQLGPGKKKLRGYCGCVLTIAHATEEHTGNWTCDMGLYEGKEIQSIVQISVMKSHLIPEIEMENDTVKLHCRTFPTMYHAKIDYCKWFLRKEGHISTENSTKYKATKLDNVCSLQLKDLNKNDIDEWTCVARLHFAGIVNATMDLQKFFDPSNTEIIDSSSADTEIIITIPFLYWYISASSIIFVAVSTAYFIFRCYKYTRCRKYHQRNKYLTLWTRGYQNEE